MFCSGADGKNVLSTRIAFSHVSASLWMRLAAHAYETCNFIASTTECPASTRMCTNNSALVTAVKSNRSPFGGVPQNLRLELPSPFGRGWSEDPITPSGVPCLCQQTLVSCAARPLVYL